MIIHPAQKMVKRCCVSVPLSTELTESPSEDVHMILVTLDSILGKGRMGIFEAIKERLRVICGDEVHFLHAWYMKLK